MIPLTAQCGGIKQHHTILYKPLRLWYNVRNEMHDPIFLAGKSEVATKEDLHVAEELAKLGYTNVKEFCGIID